MTEPLLKIDNLRIAVKTHGRSRVIIPDLSLTLERGETLGIVGESGSGKTMSMLALTRLLPLQAKIEAGRLNFAGQDLSTLGRKAFHSQVSGKRISMIFQEPMTALNPVYTIGRQLTETILLHEKVSRSEATTRAVAMLEQVLMPQARDRLRQYPHQLSGGQRQRVMIAMALLNKPDLLIADEPTTALDVTVQNEIIELLISLQKDLGMAMVFISHDLGVVSRVAGRIVVMRHGEIVEEGPSEKLLWAPSHPYTQGLLNCLYKLEDGRAPHPAAVAGPAPVLSVSGARKRYNLTSGLFRAPRTIDALKPCSFEVDKGETLAIVGESGSGKSTLAKILNGLLKPDAGEILLQGKDLESISFKDRARIVQPIFQDPYSTLNPKRTIGSIVARPLKIHGLGDEAERRARVVEALRSVGLSEEQYNRFPSQLSGGQRQRVAIARALVLKPQILICDEPTSALDVSVQDQVLDLLLELQKSLGVTLILISHDMAVVRYMADRVFVMKSGEIVEAGDALKVLDHPSHPYTQKLLTSVYHLPQPAAQADLGGRSCL